MKNEPPEGLESSQQHAPPPPNRVEGLEGPTLSEWGRRPHSVPPEAERASGEAEPRSESSDMGLGRPRPAQIGPEGPYGGRRGSLSRRAKAGCRGTAPAGGRGASPPKPERPGRPKGFARFPVPASGCRGRAPAGEGTGEGQSPSPIRTYAERSE